MAVIYGKAYWAAITTPNTKFEDQWTVDVVPDDPADFEKLKKAGFKVKNSPDGEEDINFRRKCKNFKGQDNKQPRLVDANKNPIDVQVGNGSRVCVQYDEFFGSNSFGAYQGLDLKAVQVIDLVEYAAADGSEFETHELDDEF